MNWQRKSKAPPDGYSYGGHYRASWPNRLRAILFILIGRPRSLARDALFIMRDIPAAPAVEGAEHLPRTGPFVVVANHYERPGLWMAWPALFAAHAIWERTGTDTHWIAIQEWESFSVLGLNIPPGVVRRVFERAFATYNILAMPPPYAPAAARARALKNATHLIRQGAIIGLMPEGDVGPTPELLYAREGVGSFLQLLAGAGAPIIPLGLYEDEDRLIARFGPAIDSAAIHRHPKHERDRCVRESVMHAIRDLLPLPLWGAYRD